MTTWWSETRSVSLIAKYSSHEPRRLTPESSINRSGLNIHALLFNRLHLWFTNEPQHLKHCDHSFSHFGHRFFTVLRSIYSFCPLVPRSHQHTTPAAASLTLFIMGRWMFCAASACGLTTRWIWWHLLVIPPDFAYDIIEGVVDVDARLGRRFNVCTSESPGQFFPVCTIYAH